MLAYSNRLCGGERANTNNQYSILQQLGGMGISNKTTITNFLPIIFTDINYWCFKQRAVNKLALVFPYGLHKITINLLKFNI